MMSLYRQVSIDPLRYSPALGLPVARNHARKFGSMRAIGQMSVGIHRRMFARFAS
jgi:hypothetical protein